MISVVVPCYNDSATVAAVRQRVEAVFHNHLPGYAHEVIFVDDASLDNSEQLIADLCADDPSVKAVFNARNFGFHRNVIQSLTYGSGDAVFMLFGDLQDPPELLPEMVKQWEAGHKVVLGQRRSSDESFIMRQMRGLYYRIIGWFSDSQQIPRITGFGLYDRAFIDVIREIDDVQPYFKGIIAEYGMSLAMVPYDQERSGRGRSNFSFAKNYDFAMQGITSSTKTLMRMATFVSAVIGFICIGITAYVLINKLIHWQNYPLGQASITVGIFFLGALQLFFIGILGEYILSINSRVARKPRVVVAKTLNFPPENRHQAGSGQ